MRKLRVVSTILLITLIIGLLPAEQVFAASKLYNYVGIENPDWVGYLEVGGSELDIMLRGSNNSLKEDGSLTGITFKVKSSEDSVNKIIVNPFFSSDGSGLKSTDDKDMVYGFKFRTLTADYKGSEQLGLLDHTTDGKKKGKDFWTELGKKSAYSSDYGKTYKISEMFNGESKAINIYTYDLFVTDQNDAKHVYSSSDDDWFYQRVACRYLVEEDLFFYVSMWYNQNQGAKDSIWVTGKLSKDFTVYGNIPVDKDNKTSPYKNSEYTSTLYDAMKEVLSSESTENLIADAILKKFEKHVNLHSGPIPTEDSITKSFEIRVGTEDDPNPSVSETNPVLSWVASSNTDTLGLYAALMYVTESSGRDEAKFNLLKAYKIVKTSEDRVFEVRPNWSLKAKAVFLKTNIPSEISLGDAAITQTAASDTWVSTVTDAVIDNENPIQKIEFKVDTIAWGECTTKTISEPTTMWSKLVVNAVSYVNTLKVTGTNKKSPAIVCKPNGTTGYSLIDGLGDVIAQVKVDTDKINFDSNTGVLVSDMLASLAKDACLFVDFDESAGAVLDWRKLGEKIGTSIPISNYSDLMYLVSYIEYLRGIGDNADKIQSICIAHKGRTLKLFFNAKETKDVYNGVTLGKWYTEDGNITSSHDSAAAYYGRVEEVFSFDKFAHEFLGQGPSGRTLVGRAKRAIALSYYRLTGKYLYDNAGWIFYGGDYYANPVNADQVLEVRETIGKINGSFMVTKTAMNCLSYSYANFLYARIGATSGLGERALEGVDYYVAFDTFMTEPYNRAKSLEYTEYAEVEGAGIDYLPRLPLLSGALTLEEATLLYNVDYGLSVLDWSSYAEQNNTSGDAILDWIIDPVVAETVITDVIDFIDGNGGYPTALQWAESGVYDNISDEYLHILKTIINVHKLCDCLADLENTANNITDESLKIDGKKVADSWSPAVARFYSLYDIRPDFFEAVEVNLFRYVMHDYSYSDAVEPLGFAIKFESGELSTQWKYGYGLSALHVPFRTNLYEVSSIEKMIDKPEWVTEFYYKYGFYRKALFVTTDPEATVNRYLKGTHSATKVATLRDLLNYDRDIELYVDQGFYNGKKLEDQLDRFISNTNGDSVFGSIFDACVLTPESILKDTGYSTYASDIQRGVCPLGVEITTDEQKALYEYDNFLLTEDEIVGEKGMLSAYEYSIQQPYGVVSAVYRTKAVYDAVNRASTENPPVLVSSKNVAGLSGTDAECYRAFYNYIILSSMKEVLERETTLLVDLDSPIFIDIFGNIITSNGYVIIPAAANATLSGEDFNPYSLGFATFINAADPEVYKGLTDKCYDYLYGLDYAYTVGRKSTSSYASTFRERQQEIGGGYLFLKKDGTTTLGTTSLSDGAASITVTWDYPNTHTAALKNLLLSTHFINSAEFYDSRHINLIVETLRGAPIEHIDFAEENLLTTHELTKSGAYVSYKLEQLMNAIHTDSNGTERNVKFSATLSVLDIFHIESAEKVALLVVKIALIGFLFLLAAQIVADSTIGRMPVKTVIHVVVTCALIGTCVSLLPILTEYSMATLSKTLLQPEASELLAMQSQREAYGVEIGTTESYNTKSSTNIITRVGELDVNWYDQLLFSVYSDIDNSFADLYNKEAETLPLAKASYTFTSGKDIYMDLNKVMDTTVLQYNAELGMLTNHRAAGITDADCSSSYIMPYYVFLDQLIANVNMYNKQNGVQPLSYSVNSDGTIRTKDMTYAYFHSNEFLSDDYDILDLRRIFNVASPKLGYCPIYSDEDMATMALSMWYPSDDNLSQWSESKISEAALEESISQLYAKARSYAINNSYMLSYVSDAAYLKSFAMYLAIEYNRIFGIGIADTFELKCVDTKDLLRYVVSTPQNVYKYANRTYARYAFETEGFAGVILAGVLYVAFALTNAIKVVSYVLTYTTCACSILYHRLFKKEGDYSLYGFFILIGEITILNVIFTVVFKVIMNLTRWGVPPLLAMGIAILLQVAIVLGYGFIVYNGIVHIKDLGKSEIAAIHHFFDGFSRDKHRSKGLPENAANSKEQTVATLQAHDFSRISNDNYTGDYADVEDLRAHDRRREEGTIEAE